MNVPKISNSIQQIYFQAIIYNICSLCWPVPPISSWETCTSFFPLLLRAVSGICYLAVGFSYYLPNLNQFLRFFSFIFSLNWEIFCLVDSKRLYSVFSFKPGFSSLFFFYWLRNFLSRVHVRFSSCISHQVKRFFIFVYQIFMFVKICI